MAVRHCHKSGFVLSHTTLLGTVSRTLVTTCTQDRVNLPDDDLIRLLHSLACAKYKLLLKEPAGKTISKSDVFKCGSFLVHLLLWPWC
jgi:hypothetical protein